MVFKLSAKRQSKQIKRAAVQVHSAVWPTGPSSGCEKGEEALLYAHTDEQLVRSLSHLFETKVYGDHCWVREDGESQGSFSSELMHPQSFVKTLLFTHALNP